MKKNIFYVLITFSILNISYAFEGIGGNGMVINSESLGISGSRGGRPSNEGILEAEVIKNIPQRFRRNTLSEPSISIEKSFEMNEYSREFGVGGF